MFRKAEPAPTGTCKVYPFARHVCYDTDLCPKCQNRKRFKFALRLASIKRGRARNPDHD